MARPVAFLAALAVFAVCAALAGCGGGGGGSTASTAAAAHNRRRFRGTRPPGRRLRPPPSPRLRRRREAVPGQGRRQQHPGIRQRGERSERDQAAVALHDFLDARAERNWAAACANLSRDAAKSLRLLAARSPKLQGRGCAATLAALSGDVPTSALAEAAQADVGSLRVEGDRAFLIYRGAHDAAYAILMAREGGAWKVAALSGTPLG